MKQLNDYKGLSTQLVNNQSLLKEVRKFNTRGYFHQVDPFDDQYLRTKHSAYEKHRHINDKQNFVYNLQPQRMRVGYYEMKGCHADSSNHQINKRRILKTINPTNQCTELMQQSKATSQHSVVDGRVVSCLLKKKYMMRKQRLRTKSQRALVPIYSQVRQNSLYIQENSRQASQHSLKTSEGESRILSYDNKNKRSSKLSVNHPNNHGNQKQNATIATACRDRVWSRRQRGAKMRTIQ